MPGRNQARARVRPRALGLIRAALRLGAAAVAISALALTAPGRPAAWAQERTGEPGPEAFRWKDAAVAASGVETGAATPSGTLATTLREVALTVLLTEPQTGPPPGPPTEPQTGPQSGTGTTTLWFAGLAARELALDFSGFAAAQQPLLVPGLFWAAGYVGLSFLGQGDWRFQGVLAVARYADSTEKYAPPLTGGEALWLRLTEPHTRWGWGLTVTSELGDPQLLPLISYAHWSERWTADVKLPLAAQARYWLTEGISVGAGWTVEGGSYTVTAANAPMDTARTTTGTLSALLVFGARTGAQLELAAGQTLFQRYWVLRGDQRIESFYFHPGLAESATLAWRF